MRELHRPKAHQHIAQGFSLVGGTNMHADIYWKSDYINSSTGRYYNFNGFGSVVASSNGTHYVRACLSW